MRYIISIFFLFWVLNSAHSQQTIDGSIMYGGVERAYILYVPASYQSDNAAPLVLNFHGYTSNNLEQMFYGDFRPIADTAGFLVVHPMGTTDALGNPHWNVGWGLSTVDDVGFTNALIDSLSAGYTIDQERIYSTGMSNGGFFSYKLACELSHRISAIASVTGSMNVGQTATCNPDHPMPVMEIHGTADDVVAYSGNIIFASVPSVVDFWVNKNSCNTTAVFSSIDDTDQADACTAEHYVYTDGQHGTTVEHYKIIGGAHTWPGSAFGGAGTNQDMDASAEIWRFFSKYNIHGRITTTAVDPVPNTPQVNVYPNPVAHVLTLEISGDESTKYVLFSATGQAISVGWLNSGTNELNVDFLSPGVYYLKIGPQFIKLIRAE